MFVALYCDLTRASPYTPTQRESEFESSRTYKFQVFGVGTPPPPSPICLSEQRQAYVKKHGKPHSFSAARKHVTGEYSCIDSPVCGETQRYSAFSTRSQARCQSMCDCSFYWFGCEDINAEFKQLPHFLSLNLSFSLSPSPSPDVPS